MIQEERNESGLSVNSKKSIKDKKLSVQTSFGKSKSPEPPVALNSASGSAEDNQGHLHDSVIFSKVSAFAMSPENKRRVSIASREVDRDNHGEKDDDLNNRQVLSPLAGGTLKSILAPSKLGNLSPTAQNSSFNFQAKRPSAMSGTIRRLSICGDADASKLGYTSFEWHSKNGSNKSKRSLSLL